MEGLLPQVPREDSVCIYLLGQSKPGCCARASYLRAAGKVCRWAWGCVVAWYDGSGGDSLRNYDTTEPVRNWPWSGNGKAACAAYASRSKESIAEYRAL